MQCRSRVLSPALDQKVVYPFGPVRYSLLELGELRGTPTGLIRVTCRMRWEVGGAGEGAGCGVVYYLCGGVGVRGGELCIICAGGGCALV